jgi:AcrR family transcriptional regulator
MTERLTREQWVDAGLKALARQGFTALKADLMAKELGVSRGSFYWHFADLDSFHRAVTERWQVRATEWIMADIDRLLPQQRLPALLFRAFHTDVSLEMAIRAWAFSAEPVRDAVAQVDAMRLDYTGDLLAAEGVPAEPSKAKMIYWTYLGFALSGGDARQAGPVLDELLSSVRVRPN